MLVLANEMFDSPPVFAWVLPVFVRLQPGKEETFLRVTVTYFLFFPRQSTFETSSQDDEGGLGRARARQGAWGQGKGKGKGRGKGKGKGSGARGREHLCQSRETKELPAHAARSTADRRYRRVFQAKGAHAKASGSCVCECPNARRTRRQPAAGITGS